MRARSIVPRHEFGRRGSLYSPGKQAFVPTNLWHFIAKSRRYLSNQTAWGGATVWCGRRSAENMGSKNVNTRVVEYPVVHSIGVCATINEARFVYQYVPRFHRVQIGGHRSKILWGCHHPAASGLNRDRRPSAARTSLLFFFPYPPPRLWNESGVSRHQPFSLRVHTCHFGTVGLMSTPALRRFSLKFCVNHVLTFSTMETSR